MKSNKDPFTSAASLRWTLKKLQFFHDYIGFTVNTEGSSLVCLCWWCEWWLIYSLVWTTACERMEEWEKISSCRGLQCWKNVMFSFDGCWGNKAATNCRQRLTFSSVFGSLCARLHAVNQGHQSMLVQWTCRRQFDWLKECATNDLIGWCFLQVYSCFR